MQCYIQWPRSGNNSSAQKAMSDKERVVFMSGKKNCGFYRILLSYKKRWKFAFFAALSIELEGTQLFEVIRKTKIRWSHYMWYIKKQQGNKSQ